METILITGGAGFLGSHVARQLVAMGHRVVIYDSFVQYGSPLENAYQGAMDDRFKDLLDQVTVIRGDTANKADLRRCVVAYRPNRIIHLAALPIADLSNVHSEEALNTIVALHYNPGAILRRMNFERGGAEEHACERVARRRRPREGNQGCTAGWTL